MTKQRDSLGEKEEKANQRPRKEPYLKPKLIEYGNVEKLTQGASGDRADGGVGRFRR